MDVLGKSTSKPKPVFLKTVSDDYQRWKMCGSKRRYRTRDNATAYNRDVVYRCPHCGGWHRTSRPKK